MKKNLLLRKIGLISKFMTSQPGKQTIAMCIWPISQELKATRQWSVNSQLIEHNMRNIFLEKQYTKCGGETSPKPFFKNIKIKLQTACF